MTSPLELTAAGIAARVRSGELSPTEVVKAYLARIQRVDPKIQAFLEVYEAQALADAKRLEDKLARKEPLGRLAGVPVAIKDNMLMEGRQIWCGSKILQGFRSPYDATAIARLKAADAILIGRANMDEFAMGSSTENSAYFKTKNPWDLARVPGGSSGGSTAAVAARLAPLGLGSDTGGSIRQPAALCGVVGLKPTYGLVSRYGLVAFASSLDQIGPLATNVEDAALALTAIAGHDPRDSTSAPRAGEDYVAALAGSIKGLRIGLPKEYFIEGLDPEVSKLIQQARRDLEKLGAVFTEVSLPHTEHAVSVYYIIAPSEASANLARFDGIRYGFSAAKNGAANLLEVYEKTRAEGFGPEVKRRIMLGTYALSSGYYDAYYGKAQRVRTLIKRDFEEAFKSVDLLLTPTSPTAAFKFGEKTSDPLQMYLSDIFTIPCNMAGISGVSVPCGFTTAGLPVGLQLLGRPFEEGLLLRAAARYEEATAWRKAPPEVTA